MNFSTNVDEMLQRLGEGGLASTADFFSLFVLVLHSERVAFHGFILEDLPFPAADLAKLDTFPALRQRGVWPPQYVLELQLKDAHGEVVAESRAVYQLRSR